MGGEPLDQVLEFRAMGSPCVVRVAGEALTPAAVHCALQAAREEVLRIERHFSRYRDDSTVARINRAAGQPQAVALDEETAALLQFADRLHRESGGCFDITSGVLRRVWDFRTLRLPHQGAVAHALGRIGWHKVDFSGHHIRLPEAGMELDFGGFGKEYAADRAATLLREAGHVHGYVNLGGDLRLLGPMPDGAPWKLAIADPRRPGQAATGVAMTTGALATSGDYERYFELDGRRYCHILDPFTGWPVQAHWQSVSVVAPSCLAAGALSTVAMLKGPQAAAFLAEQGVAWVGVDQAGQVHHHGLAAAVVAA